MPWLLFLASLAALVIAFRTTSVGLLVFCLLVSLVLGLTGLMQLLARRVGSRSRDESMMVDPEVLRRMREQAEARKAVDPRQP